MPAKFTTSVNIIRDSDRDLNYIPTANATRVISQIGNDFKKGVHSFNIIGSYGTGKSSFLWAVEQSIKGKKKYFSIDFISNPTTKYINLVGEYRSLRESLAELLSIKNTKDVTENIFSEIFNQYHDLGKTNSLLFIVIDEFGKFLEYASGNEPEKELYFIQQLAEFVNNPDYNIVLITTLHQNFDAYSISLDRIQRQEWTKVKGRFREITFNEPIEQLLFLASEYQEIRPSALLNKTDIAKSVELLVKSKAFDTNIDYVSGIAEKLYPLDVFAANIITSSLQKYGQNERSLFSFLESTDNSGLIYHTRESNSFYNIPNVYDFLIFNFYSFINSKYNPDFAAWKSIKNALEEIERTFKSEINAYSKIIKTIGLLNMSTATGSTLDKPFLILYSEVCLGIKNGELLIEELERKNIILFRKYSKSYVLLGGTDLDIQSALINAANKVSEVTDITTLLNKYYQLPTIIAKEATYNKGTPRLFEYRITEYLITEEPIGEIDGFINLIFNSKIKPIDVINHSSGEKGAVLYGYYQNPKDIRDLLFEIEKTRKVIEDNEDDKVAVRELTNIVTHQQNLLNHKILNNFYNSKKEIIWIFSGTEYPVRSKKEFNKLLSYICNEVYSKAPAFNNELVNKHKISASIHSAKRQFYKALVLNWDKPDLDFPKDKFPPEKTIYLSLLKSNGIELYSNSIVNEIKVTQDNNFHYLWEASIEFINNAKSARRKVSEFNDILGKKPFKLKQGLIDFWVPSFLFINRDDYALFGESGYIPFITDEVLELLVKYPDLYEIKTFDIAGVKLDIFNSYRLFLNQTAEGKLSNETFIETIKPFLTFYRGLPEYSRFTQRLDREALSIRDAISNSKDPEQTFFEDFPAALGYTIDRIQNSKDDLQKYIIKLQNAIRDLRTCYDALINRIELFIQNEIIGETVDFEEYKSLLQLRYKKLKKHLLLTQQKSFVQRLDSQIDDKKAWFNSLVQALIGNSLEKLKDEEEIMIYEKFKAMILELDSLTNISKTDFSEDKEDVMSLEINSFFEGFSKKLVRLPKSKKFEVKAIENTLKENLSNDKTLNIAALANVLQDLLKK